MGISFIIVAGAAVSLTALYVLATRTATAPALAGENTAVGLRDAASETLTDGRMTSRIPTEWQLATVEGLTEAEDMLDSLEAHGYADRELVVLGNSSFAVRWR